MSFYRPEDQGIKSHDEAIEYAKRHERDGDPLGYGYDHCSWCGNEWPCTVATLWHYLEFARY